MTVIGLTGPTGSGKSTATAVALQKGFKVIDCDKEARAATEKGSSGLKALVNAFGDRILLSDGGLDRKKLAEIAFQSPQNTEILNKQLLPFVLEIIREKIECFKADGADKILLDAPTLYESGADKLCDTVIAVLSNEDLRRKRIIARDGLTENEADIRLAASKPDSFYTSKTKHVVYNNDSADEFESKVSALFDKI